MRSLTLLVSSASGLNFGGDSGDVVVEVLQFDSARRMGHNTTEVLTQALSSKYVSQPRMQTPSPLGSIQYIFPPCPNW